MTLINGTNILRKSFSEYPIKRASAEGYPLVIKDAMPGYLKDYTIYGNEGGVGYLVNDENDENYGKYKISIVNSGKNMLKATSFYSVCGKDYSELMEDGRNCVRFTGSSGRKYEGLNFKENTQYTVSFYYKTTIKNTDNTEGSVIFRFLYADGSNDSIAVKRDVDWQYIKLASDAGKTVVDIGLSTYNYENWMYIDVDTFQLEEGTQETTYEPYRDSVKTELLSSQPVDISNKLNFYKDNLPHIKIFNGTNRIEVENNVAPVKMIATYNCHTKRELF